jgi:hypothetical protein
MAVLFLGIFEAVEIRPQPPLIDQSNADMPSNSSRAILAGTTYAVLVELTSTDRSLLRENPPLLHVL